MTDDESDTDASCDVLDQLEMAVLVDLGFNVMATRIPTLEEAARTLDLVIEGLERGIKDRIRCGYSAAEYETDVFAHAGLTRVQKLVRCTMFCEAEVTETIKVALSKLKAQERDEQQRVVTIEKDRKERARQWVQKRKDEKQREEAVRQEAAE